MISELARLLVERIVSALSARLRDCSQPASRKIAVITKAFVTPEVALMRADMDTVQDASVSLPMRNVKLKSLIIAPGTWRLTVPVNETG